MTSRSPAAPRARAVQPSMLLWALLVTALVGVVVFLNTLDNGLTYDDPRILETASHLKDSGVPDELRGRSLTLLSHAVDAAVWRDWLPGRRLTNLALFGLITSLVTWLTWRWTWSLGVAVLTGLVFAVHPVHVEAMAGLGFRKDLLALLFSLLVVLFWQAALRSWVRILTTTIFLVLGLLSKEVAVIGVVPFLFVLEMSRTSDTPSNSARIKHSVRRVAPLLGVGVVVAALLGTALHSPTAGGGLLARFQPAGILQITEGRLHTYGQVLEMCAATFPDVLRLLVFPHRLSIDYPLVAPSEVAIRAILGTLLFLVVCGFGIQMFRRGAYPAALAVFWFLMLYFPVSNVVPLTHFFLADRYLFTPSFGVCLLFGLGVHRLWRWARGRGLLARVLPLGIALVVLLSGAVQTVQRNRDWRDDVSLWSAAIRDGFITYRAYNNLGALLLQRGRFEPAEVSYRNALRLYPLAPDPHRGLAVLMLRKNRLDEAVEHMSASLNEAPDQLELRVKLAETLQRLGHLEEAIHQYELAQQGIVSARRQGRTTTIQEQDLQMRIQQIRNSMP